MEGEKWIFREYREGQLVEEKEIGNWGFDFGFYANNVFRRKWPGSCQVIAYVPKIEGYESVLDLVDQFAKEYREFQDDAERVRHYVEDILSEAMILFNVENITVIKRMKFYYKQPLTWRVEAEIKRWKK
ncbi:MAG: hypothetical protein QXQ60_06685 [Thermofilum sp.]